jgi:hypothetical protein
MDKKKIHAILTSHTARKVIMMKVIITMTFVTWVIHPGFATPVAMIGNILWLWGVPGVDEKLLRKHITALLTEVKDEVEGRS